MMTSWQSQQPHCLAFESIEMRYQQNDQVVFTGGDPKYGGAPAMVLVGGKQEAETVYLIMFEDGNAAQVMEEWLEPGDSDRKPTKPQIMASLQIAVEKSRQEQAAEVASWENITKVTGWDPFKSLDESEG